MGMNILICDESKSDARELTDILGYSYGSAMKVRTLNRATDARYYIRMDTTVDICFLEIVMQEMNGIVLAKTLRTDGYKGNFIFISRNKAFGPETYEVKALDYLLKPIMPQDVRKAVDKWKTKQKCNVY